MKSDILWAPWRLSYIVTANEKEKDEEFDRCFLCRYRENHDDDAENFVIERTGQTITVLNRYPYNNGHLLVAPLQHKADLNDLTDEELTECMFQVRKIKNLLVETIHPDGFNIGLNLGRVAGAGLPGHLHWHIVPRWSGDTNFMTTVSDVTVIPQSLEELHRFLVEKL